MIFQKITFIVNPTAGRGTVGKEWPHIKELARQRLGPFDSVLTNGPGDGIKLTRNALQNGSDLIVCVGGDGTFNEVLNGYMDEDCPISHKVTFGYIPKGTGLDICKTIPIPKEIEKALDLLINAIPPRLIDIGRIRYMDHSGKFSYRYFHNIVTLWYCLQKLR